MVDEKATVSIYALLSPDTVVWSGAVVEARVKSGLGCVIGSNVFVGSGTEMGEAVRINHGCFIPRNTKIGNYVFFGPNVTITDDRYPRVNNPEYHAMPPVFEDHCSIGGGATILPGIRIGEYALVGAGAVVTRDVPDFAVVVGVPARVKEIKIPEGVYRLKKEEIVA